MFSYVKQRPSLSLSEAVFFLFYIVCVCVFVRVSVCLTQAAELTDDGRERVVHHTLQLAADALGELPSAEVTGLDVPLHQWHGKASHRHKLQGYKGNKQAHTVLDTCTLVRETVWNGESSRQMLTN